MRSKQARSTKESGERALERVYAYIRESQRTQSREELHVIEPDSQCEAAISAVIAGARFGQRGRERGGGDTCETK